MLIKNVWVTDCSFPWFPAGFQSDLYPIFIQCKQPSDFGYSLMTKCFHGLNSSSLSCSPFSAEHLHSEPRNSFPANRNHKLSGKLRLLLVERNNIKMNDISRIAQVLPAKGTVKFHETPHLPPPTQTVRPCQCPSVPSVDSCSKERLGDRTHSQVCAASLVLPTSQWWQLRSPHLFLAQAYHSYLYIREKSGELAPVFQFTKNWRLVIWHPNFPKALTTWALGNSPQLRKPIPVIPKVKVNKWQGMKLADTPPPKGDRWSSFISLPVILFETGNCLLPINNKRKFDWFPRYQQGFQVCAFNPSFYSRIHYKSRK